MPVKNDLAYLVALSDRKKFYESLVNKKWNIINDAPDFANYNILITKASGSIIEFLAKGFSVLVVENNDPLASNPLEQYGKKIIWNSIKKPNDFNFAINKLYECRIKKYEKIKEISNKFKFEYFKEITANNIRIDFNL